MRVISSLVLAPVAWAQETKLPDRILGKADAPVTVEEYISLTCPHCAEFYTTTLPELEKRYVDSGKVRFILRDFPLDGPALKAATVLSVRARRVSRERLGWQHRNIMAS